MSDRQDRILDAFESQMLRHKREMLNELNRQLFNDASGITRRTPYIPPTRMQRWKSATRIYFLTLWKALRGDDPYAGEDDEY